MSWVPTADDAGVYGVTFLVTNAGNGNPAAGCLRPGNDPPGRARTDQAPVLQNPGNPTIAEGQTLTVVSRPPTPTATPRPTRCQSRRQASTFDPAQRHLNLDAERHPGRHLSECGFRGERRQQRPRSQTDHNSRHPDGPAATPAPIGNYPGRENRPWSSRWPRPARTTTRQLRAVTPLPSGASSTHRPGQFTWTPDYTQSGNYSLIFSATVPSGLSDTTTVSIQIANVDRPPTHPGIRPVRSGGGAAGVHRPRQRSRCGRCASSYSASGLPAGASLDPEYRRLPPGRRVPVKAGDLPRRLLGFGRPVVGVQNGRDRCPPGQPVADGDRSSDAQLPGVNRASKSWFTRSLRAWRPSRPCRSPLDGQPVRWTPRVATSTRRPHRASVQFLATATDVDGNVGQARAVVKVLDPVRLVALGGWSLDPHTHRHDPDPGDGRDRLGGR